MLKYVTQSDSKLSATPETSANEQLEIKEAIIARYGSFPANKDFESNEVIKTQLEHRSVRKFLNTPVTDSQLNSILAAASSASTSSNLNSWSVVVVQDPERKAKLAELSGNQEFINSAPIMLVWLSDLHRNAEIVNSESATPVALAYLESFLVAAIDATLAAQNALLAAESLGLGGVYIGAIRNRPEEVAELLELPEQVFPVLGMLIGVPDLQEEAGIKPRLGLDGVVHFDKYQREQNLEAVSNYDRVISSYYANYNRQVSWKRTVSSRLKTVDRLHGREKLQQALKNLGFELL